MRTYRRNEGGGREGFTKTWPARRGRLPAKHGRLMSEITHANKGNDRADKGQPLEAGGHIRVSCQP